MINREKRVLVREISRLLNKIEHPVALIQGLLLLPNLNKEIRKELDADGWVSWDESETILREDPEEAYDEIISNIREIMKWFRHHPTLKLKIKNRKLNPVTSLNKAIKTMKAKKESFLEGYENGDLPDGVVELANTATVLEKICIPLINSITEIVKTLPPEDGELAMAEYMALSENEASPYMVTAIELQSDYLN